MEIVTARLRIDALRDADARALYELRNDPAVARWQGWRPDSPEAALRFIREQQGIEPGVPDSWWQRAIRLRETDCLIGDLGLHFMQADGVELGITIAPAHQRRGHAHEALEVMLDFVFGGLRKQQAWALVDARNTPSVRLLEGLGMHAVDDPNRPPRTVVEAGYRVYLLARDEWLADPADDHAQR